jgi:hypothetical protein
MSTSKSAPYADTHARQALWPPSRLASKSPSTTSAWRHLLGLSLRLWPSQAQNGAQADVLSVPCAGVQQGPALLARTPRPLCRVRRLPPQRAIGFPAGLMRTRAFKREDAHVSAEKRMYRARRPALSGSYPGSTPTWASRNMRWFFPLVRPRERRRTLRVGPRHTARRRRPPMRSSLFRSTQRGCLLRTQARIRLARPLWPLVGCGTV